MGNECDRKLMESFHLVLGGAGQNWRPDVYQEVREDPYSWEDANYIHFLNKRLVLRGVSLSDAPIMYC